MLLPASQEYITLCQSQISLLIQGLRASEIAVYMTEQIESDASLKPLVVYPENASHWPDIIGYLNSNPNQISAPPLLLESAINDNVVTSESFEIPVIPLDPAKPEFVDSPPHPSPERQQIVLPLMHDNAVLGILMVARIGQSWSPIDQAQIEQVANTLSMACILDQRSQWLSRSGFEKQALLSEEHQRLSKLLHQFRNPLTALRTLGKLMMRRMTSQDPNRDFAQSIVQQSDRLEMMLKEFSQTLDVGEETIEAFEQTWTLAPSEDSTAFLPAAGIISGGELSLQPCWLTEILEPITSASIGRLEERQMALNQSLAENLPPVLGDIKALTEVFSNLIDNAIKYTPEGGTITLQLTQDVTDNEIHQVVSISDTGYGIPKEDLDRVFEGKYRGIQEESNIQGTGLGLAIAQELIRKMSGSIEAISPALTPKNSQIGSTFIVRIPEIRR